MKRWMAGMALAAVAAAAQAQVVNGGFESGLAGWTSVDQPGSDGGFALQTGTGSPVNLLPVQAPPVGVSAAMTDAGGPGSHVLYQDILIPTSITTATLSFQIQVRSDAAFETPDHLDFGTADLNQQARVDLMLVGTDVFSTSVLQNLFRTMPGDPLVSGYTLYSIDVASVLQAHAGQTLRLRFAEVDNVGIFNVGIDAVTLSVNAAPIPEPGTVWLAAVGLLAVGWAARRRR